MKQFIYLLILLPVHSISRAQNPDSLLEVKYTSPADSNKVQAMIDKAIQTEWNDPETSIKYSIKALEASQKIGYVRGHIESLLVLGEALAVTGNYSASIETTLKALKEAEKKKPKYILDARVGLAAVNFYQGDYHETIRYSRKVLEDERNYLDTLNLVVIGFLGEAFTKLGQIDSALYYTQLAYQIDLKASKHWSIPYFTLGEIYLHLHQYTLALEYYRMGLAADPPVLDSIIGQLGMATVFKEKGVKDSTLAYSRKSIQLAKLYKFPKYLVEAYGLIKDVYKKEGRLDSAFIYQELMLAANDSIFATGKLNAVKTIKFNEQIRELEMKQAADELKINRQHNLQYAAIAIALITFIVLFFSLSSSVIVKEKFIRFFGIIALLLVFEFINLFSHPFISDITDQSPLLIFLIMVCIASLLVPAHHRLEKWVTHQLVEKNKRIRLAAAKKTIASLEGNA